jgi:hypothetical protein
MVSHLAHLRLGKLATRPSSPPSLRNECATSFVFLGFLAIPFATLAPNQSFNLGKFVFRMV